MIKNYFHQNHIKYSKKIIIINIINANFDKLARLRLNNKIEDFQIFLWKINTRKNKNYVKKKLMRKY